MAGGQEEECCEIRERAEAVLARLESACAKNRTIRILLAEGEKTAFAISMRLKERDSDIKKAKENGVPLAFWRYLQAGESRIGEDGTVYEPSMVLAEDRKGLKVTYCTDSRPKDSLVKLAEGSDLFICEGMYGEADKEEKAAQHKHMSFREAAEMAKAAGVKELWLTHFSPAMPAPKAALSEATAVFENTRCGKDRLTREFVYEE